ncbi:MAG: DUF885 domain-containing protein [Alphaproteobacteria bacterium]|nr:DUF885 domain-containing protein [Alphaproteobacteria bacterium]
MQYDSAEPPDVRARTMMAYFDRVLAGLDGRVAAVDGFEGLTEAGELARSRLRIDLEVERAQLTCPTLLWDVSIGVDPLEDTRTDGAVQVDEALAWYRSEAMMAAMLPTFLAAGLEKGLVDDRASLEAAVEQWRARVPPTKDALAGVRGKQRKALERAERAWRLAYVELADHVEREILPRARENPGLAGLPADCYAGRLLDRTDVAHDPSALHDTWSAEVEAAEARLAERGAVELGVAPEAVLPTLRAKREGFADAAALEARVREVSETLRARVDVGWAPETPCEPVPMAWDTRRDWYPRAAYSEGELLYDLERIPTWELAAIVAHECWPGHHVQRSFPADQSTFTEEDLRRRVSAAFVEGWAVHAERLALEAGAIDGVDALGVLSDELLHAARVVVDTGLHHHGWSRAEAEAYLRAHTALDDRSIGDEVGRALSQPGSRVAYAVGGREIARLHGLAREALGDGFDAPGFHRSVLASAGVPMGDLERVVRSWVETRRLTPP